MYEKRKKNEERERKKTTKEDYMMKKFSLKKKKNMVSEWLLSAKQPHIIVGLFTGNFQVLVTPPRWC